MKLSDRCKLEGVKLDFDGFLMEKHAEQYIGTDDMMVDDFADWIQDLGVDDLLDYEKKYISNLQVPEPREALDKSKLLDTILLSELYQTNDFKGSNPFTMALDLEEKIYQKFGKVDDKKEKVIDIRKDCAWGTSIAHDLWCYMFEKGDCFECKKFKHTR